MRAMRGANETAPKQNVKKLGSPRIFVLSKRLNYICKAFLKGENA